MGDITVTLPLNQISESRTATVDGRRIHYYDWGNANASTVYICIHGWAGGGIDFYALSQSFAKKDMPIRLIALDIPGAGFSARPAESLGMDGYVRFLANWFAYVRQNLVPDPAARLIPIAHSMGGHMLLRTLWTYRFGPLAPLQDSAIQDLIQSFDRIVLLAPDGLRGEEGPLLAVRNRSIIRKFGPLLSEELMRQNLRRVYFDPRNCPAIVENLSFEAFHFEHGFAALADITLDTLATQPLDGQLSAFELPILLFWGKQDNVLNFRYSRVFASQLPQLDFEALDQCGHALQTDHADFVAQRITEFSSLP